VKTVENSKIQSYYFVVLFHSQERKAVQVWQVTGSLLSSTLLPFFIIPLRLKEV